MNINNLEHFRYNIIKEPKLGRIIYSTKSKLNKDVKTYLNGQNLTNYRLSKRNMNNKNNRSFNY